MGSTYLYTAYTGSDSALFNGVTACKKAGIKTKKNRPLSLELIDGWNNVQLVVIDEESFVNRLRYNELDMRASEIGDKRLAFGGFFIIFVGDFCQFEPIKSTSEHFLFSALPESQSEQMVNETVILERKH